MTPLGLHNIAAQNVEILRDEGLVQVKMDLRFTAPNHYYSNQLVTLVTPRLVCGNDSVELPSIGLYGDRPWYHYMRGGTDALQSDNDLKYRAKSCPELLFYVKNTIYQPWMDRAVLKLVRTDILCCQTNEEMEHYITAMMAAKMSIVPAKPIVEEKIYKRRSRANIGFVVGRTEIQPDYGNNQMELGRIRNSIESVRNDSAATTTGLLLKGYASPEGTWERNNQLAKGRIESLRHYVIGEMNVPDDIVSTSYQPEDWEGFREFVVDHRDSPQLPHADKILKIIDKQWHPDKKLAHIAMTYPKEYRYLLLNCFPDLRRTEYTLKFKRRKLIEQQLPPDTVYSLREAPLTVLTYDQSRPYRPILALKTNLLIPVNAEIEVPFGAESRWSLLAEYWAPWFVWRQNSRAFEIQSLGFELRYWAWPRCQPCRPTLTGTFIGAYVQTGKYDLEWNSKGDQGEFTSVGLTLGHSWLLSKHWNLELSLGIGALWGPQRHYNGEYEDTHLIWKRNRNLFYAGPTKLKFSLVWLLGSAKKQSTFHGKGGRQW